MASTVSLNLTCLPILASLQFLKWEVFSSQCNQKPDLPNANSSNWALLLERSLLHWDSLRPWDLTLYCPFAEHSDKVASECHTGANINLSKWKGEVLVDTTAFYIGLSCYKPGPATMRLSATEHFDQNFANLFALIKVDKIHTVASYITEASKQKRLYSNSHTWQIAKSFPCFYLISAFCVTMHDKVIMSSS